MVHFVCPANSSYISMIAAGKPFEPLMNDHIMYKEISKAVQHNTEADGLQPPHMIISTEVYQKKTWDGENKGK